MPTPESTPKDITSGPDGNLWFTESNSNKIGRITPSGVFTEFPIPTPFSVPTDVAPGPDGNLWFTEVIANTIGLITPTGAIREFLVAGCQYACSRPVGVASGPDGNMWFTVSNRRGGRIGVIHL